MNKGWTKIHITSDRFSGEVIKNMLENHDIACVIIDKKDSAYQVFGEVELYVHQENVIKAKHLINKQQEKD